MSARGQEERLGDHRQYVILILRLLVDRDGQVVQGEVGGIKDRHDTERWVRFRGAERLLGAIHDWLAARPAAGSDP